MQAQPKQALLNAESYTESLRSNREATLKQTEEAIQKLFKGSASLEDLETAIAHSEDSDVQRILMEGLSKILGESMARKILESDGEYRKKLNEIQADLSKTLNLETEDKPLSDKEKGPVLLKGSSLEKLVAIQEIFGSHAREMIQAFDLGRKNPELQATSTKPALEVTYALNKNTGESYMRAVVDLNFASAQNSAAGNVNRSFLKIKPETPTPGTVEKTSVTHYIFKLGAEFQGDGLAADMLSESLKVYDKIGVKEIKTEANIDMGGYVWQSYGFSWDMEAAASDTGLRPSESMNKDEYQEAAERNLRIYIKRKIGNAKNNAIQRLQQMSVLDASGKTENKELQGLIDSYDTLAERGTGATPQELARIGAKEKNLRFYRQVKGTGFTEEVTWMTAQVFEQRRSSGEINAEEAKKIEQNAFHIGKLGMAHEDFSWSGKIDLSQGSPTRRILEEKLARSTNS